MDQRELDEIRSGIAASQQTLVAALHAGERDPATPSRLPGWTLGHVLTHLARNADSIVRVTDAAAGGDEVERYAGGERGRDDGIAAGAARPWGELVDDIIASNDRLDVALDRPADDPVWTMSAVESDGSTRPIAQLPMLRWREVEVHFADLGIGHTPADWPAGYVRRDLRFLDMQHRSRLPMGVSVDAAYLALAPHARLAWLLGRDDAPAGPSVS